MFTIKVANAVPGLINADFALFFPHAGVSLNPDGTTVLLVWARLFRGDKFGRLLEVLCLDPPKKAWTSIQDEDSHLFETLISVGFAPN